MAITKSKFTILRQVCKLIPRSLISQLSKKYDVNKRARKFTPWSHVVALVFAQLAHSLSLNDIADTLSVHQSALSEIGSAVPPSRNGLSHANKVRDAGMAEELFWKVLSHHQQTYPKFGYGRKYSGVPKKFKKAIYAADSTTIQLVANCMDWAKHRRKKAAAKCHMTLNLQSFLPHFAIVKSAASNDAKEAKKLCSTLKDGEILVFDKAYVDYEHLYELDSRGVFWVTRSKKNMKYKVVGQHSNPKKNIHRDILIELDNKLTASAYPHNLRLVEATVLIDGEKKRMTFITNNMTWSSNSICDLYKCRWGVEVFFKQIKQTLQLADFLGQSENAVRWQIWMALLTYILIRLIGYISKWTRSFSRLFTLLRGAMWNRYDINSLVDCYGTAKGPPRINAVPSQVYFPGLVLMK